jgi:hypothetical protein
MNQIATYEAFRKVAAMNVHEMTRADFDVVLNELDARLYKMKSLSNAIRADTVLDEDGFETMLSHVAENELALMYMGMQEVIHCMCKYTTRVYATPEGMAMQAKKENEWAQIRRGLGLDG